MTALPDIPVSKVRFIKKGSLTIFLPFGYRHHLRGSDFVSLLEIVTNLDITVSGNVSLLC